MQMSTTRIAANDCLKLGLLVTYQGKFFLAAQKELQRRLVDYLADRGFSSALPLTFQQDGDSLVIEQEEPAGRVARTHPRLVGLLQRIKHGDVQAVREVYGLLLAQDDDRAEAFGKMSVDVAVLPASDTPFAADTGVPGDGHSDQQMTSQQWADKQMCRKALLFLEGK